MSEIKCPFCGKANSEGRDICAFCQARLLPLAETPTGTPEETPAPSSPAGGEADWLQNLRMDSADMNAGEETSPEEPVDQGTEAPGDDGDWLSRIRQRTQDEQAFSPFADTFSQFEKLDADKKEEEAGVQDWLKNLPMEEESQPSSEPEAEESNADWLERLRKSHPELASDESDQEPSLDQGGLTADFHFSQPPAEENVIVPAAMESALPPFDVPSPESSPFNFDTPSSPAVTPEAAAGSEGGLPDWLQSSQPLPETPEHSLQPEPAGNELPDWLKTGESSPAEDTNKPSDQQKQPEPESPTPFGFTPDELQPAGEQGAELPFSSDNLPDWLSQPAETAEEAGSLEETPFLETTPDQEGETLEPAHLPAWLQSMRPVEAVIPEKLPPVQASKEETAGPLAGISGVLGAVDLKSQYSKPPVYSIKLRVTEKQRLHADLLKSMLEEPAPAGVAAAGKRSQPRVLRIVLSLLVMAALALTLISGVRLLPVSNLLPPELVTLFNTVESLSPEQPVLMAADYEPGLAGEMRWVSKPLLEQLLRRGNPLGLLSTSPAGTILLEDSLVQAAGSREALAGKVVNLGYLAGGTSGLQSFVANPRQTMPVSITGAYAWNEPALSSVHQVSDFAAVILLTDSVEDGRAWLEQVQPYLGSTPLLVFSSAQAAPMLQPYVDSGQIKGMAAGAFGAALYQQLVQPGSPTPLYLEAINAGMLIILAVILVGGLVSIFSGKKRPRKKK